MINHEQPFFKKKLSFTKDSIYRFTYLMTISKIVAKWDVGVGWGNPKGERSCKVGAGGKTGDSDDAI